tara:strand:- start:833 stop:1153 length:321 start_codon:yes stop_codon:yes gene_type:complete
MNIYKNLIYLLLIIFLTSCGTVKEGFSNQKKNNSDEFLVEKKSPLIMPPDFDELPIPKNELNKKDDKQNAIKKLISKQENETSDIKKTSTLDANLEKTLIEKINNN